MAQIANTSKYVSDDGTQLLVPGGTPAALSGPIHLCTRADNNNTRYFDGKVAYLGAIPQLPPCFHIAPGCPGKAPGCARPVALCGHHGWYALAILRSASKLWLCWCQDVVNVLIS